MKSMTRTCNYILNINNKYPWWSAKKVSSRDVLISLTNAKIGQGDVELEITSDGLKRVIRFDENLLPWIKKHTRILYKPLVKKFECGRFF